MRCGGLPPGFIGWLHCGTVLPDFAVELWEGQHVNMPIPPHFAATISGLGGTTKSANDVRGEIWSCLF
jgi:hypothetical protein